MAPTGQTLRVHGLREFLRGTQRAEKKSAVEVRAALREVGEHVRREAAHLFERVDPHTAEGYRTKVRATGVSVEQTIRRTTGLRPDYGGLQMREALLPAVDHSEHATEVALEEAIDRIADHFER